MVFTARFILAFVHNDYNDVGVDYCDPCRWGLKLSCVGEHYDVVD